MAAAQELAQAERPAAPGVTRGDEEQQAARQQERQTLDLRPIRGMVTSWLNVGGDPATMVFTGSGGLLTSEFALADYELGTIQAQIELTLTAQSLAVRTTDPEGDDPFARLFGARLTLDADIPFQPERPGSIHLTIDDMLLARASAAAGLPVEVLGELDADLFVELTGLSPQGAVIHDALITVDRLALAQAQLAERITIRPRLNNGVLDVPIELVQTALAAPGPTRLGEERPLSLSVQYDLAAPDRVRLTNLRADRYPLVLPARDAEGRYILAELSVAAPVLTLEAGPQGPLVRGDVRGGAQVWVGDRPFELEQLADAAMEATATRTRIALDRLEAELIGIGDIRGGGALELADLPGQSTLWLHARGIDLSALARRLHVPEGAQGTADAALAIQPAPGERPRGEVLVNFAFQGTGARWRTVTIDSGQLIAYLTRAPRPDDSPSRGPYDFTILTTERAHFQVAGGTVDFYGKLRNRGARETPYPQTPAADTLTSLLGGGDDWYVNASLDVANINLAEVGPLIKQDPTGRLGASMVAYGNLNQPPRLPGDGPGPENPIPINGEGSLWIREAQLRRFNVFQRILEVAERLATIVSNPRRDELDARFRLEQGNFFLENVRAFVDGVEIRGSGQLRNVLDTDYTTIDATVVVFLRPLAQIPLPFFREADDIFAALQSQLTQLRVTGTLREPVVTQATVQDVGQTIRVLLSGEGKKSNSGPSGRR